MRTFVSVMPSYLQIENISKSYGPKVLFKGIDFNINEGDKIALIAPNGTGKTSLLRILAGKDSSDSGGKVLGIAVMVDRSMGILPLTLPLRALLSYPIQTFAAKDCPLCASGVPVQEIDELGAIGGHD